LDQIEQRAVELAQRTDRDQCAERNEACREQSDADQR
jgi:hypothetical protein